MPRDSGESQDAERRRLSGSGKARSEIHRFRKGSQDSQAHNVRAVEPEDAAATRVSNPDFSNRTAPAVSTPLDRWLLDRLRGSVPAARVRFCLWDGFELSPATADPVGTICFNTPRERECLSIATMTSATRSTACGSIARWHTCAYFPTPAATLEEQIARRLNQEIG